MWIRSVLQLAARCAALVAIALVLAVVANAVSPRGISWLGSEAFAMTATAERLGLRTVTLSEVRELIAEGDHVILDARSAEHFVEGHLPGAMSMPIAQAGEVFAELQILLTPDQPILVYCSGEACDESLRLGEFLREQGLAQVAVFLGGMTEWTSAGEEVESGA